MGESFQDYSLIQDFEADFPQKVSLKMLNLADFNSSDLFSVHLWAIGHLKHFVGMKQVLRFEFWKKFKILEIFNFYPCSYHLGLEV